MGNKWGTLKLSEFAFNASRRFDFKNKEKVVFINTGDVSSGKFLHKNLISSKGLPGQAKKAIRKGDILFSEIRPNNNRFALVDFDDCGNFVVSTKFMVLEINQEIMDLEFFYLLLTTPKTLSDFQHIAESRSGTFPQITFDAISHYPFPSPDKKNQQLIKKVLLDITNKMDICSRINQTLEQMSQTLFKSWFVDFDPVIDNALDAGNPIPEALKSRAELRQKVRNSADAKPLPADIRALFPVEFEETELGCVPRGWKEGSIPDIAFINSTSWGTKNQPDYVNYVDLSNAKDGIISSIEVIPFEDAPSRARRILKKDDLIFGLVRPANRSFAYVHADGLTGSTGFAVVRAKNTIYKNFIYYFVTYDKNVEELARIADGGAYPAIKPDDICSLPLIIPPEEIVQRFDESTSNFRDLMNNSLVQNDYLTALRDTLLPKLISGELSLEDLPNLVAQTEPA